MHLFSVFVVYINIGMMIDFIYCAALVKKKKSFLYLDMDLVSQHSCSEDHGFGSSLELFAHVE